MTHAWSQRPVRELCSSIVDCVNKTASVVPDPTPYRMARTTNVKNGRVDLSTVRYVTEETYRRWTRRGTPQVGDILLTREAPLGEVGMVKDAAGLFLGQRLVLYRPDPEKCDASFLLHVMRSDYVQTQIKSFGSGATVEHMRVPDCGELMIRCPDVGQQRRMGAILAAFDELIEINERRIELLEDLARSLYREWFVRFRFPGYRTARIVDTEVGPLPMGWKPCTIDDVVSVLTRGVSPHYAEDGLWVTINQRCVRQQRVEADLARRQDRFVPVAKRVELGDVLVNSTGVGTLGRTAVFLDSDRYVTADSHVTIVRAADDHLKAWLALHMLARESELTVMGTGSTGQTELSRRAIGALQLVLPPDETLEAFSVLAWPLLADARSRAVASRKLATTRDLLLPRLVTGRLDISDIDLGDLLPAEAA